MSSRHVLFFLVALMLLASCAIFLNRSYLLNPIYINQQLTGPFEKDNNCYIALTGHEEISSHVEPSLAIVLEDGKILPGQSNSLHQSIRDSGSGSFSFWHEHVYFSSSDNSDPNINGRTYSISFPYIFRVHIAITIYILTLLLLSYAVSTNRTWFYDIIVQIRDYYPSKKIYSIIATLFIALMQLAIINYLLSADISATFLRQVINLDFSLIIFCGIILVIGFWIRGFIGTAITLCTIIIMFLLPLVAIWHNPNVLQGIALGGLLPLTDANGYYLDSSAMLDGFPIGWSARRPLFVGLLVSLLKVTGSNLSYCIILFALINALGTFFLAKQLSVTHSSLSGAVTSILSIMYYMNGGGIGTTMTENLGLALGVTSIAIIYAAISHLSKPMMLIGVYCLTLALCARAGTFFILPCLIISSGLIFKNNRKFNPLFSALTFLTVSFGFATNFILERLISNRNIAQSQFSNFSYTLYGVVVGGKGWKQVMNDYPLAREGADIYKLAFAHFISHPLDLLKGMFNMWAEYLPGHTYHAFQFVRINNRLITTVDIQLSLYFLLVTGILWCFVNLKNNHAKFVLLATTGYFASIPFSPPIDAGLRVYAASIGIIFILPAISISWFARMIHIKVGKYLAKYKQLIPSTNTSYQMIKNINIAQICFAVLLILFSTAGPIIIMLTSAPPIIHNINCQQSQEKIHFRYNAASSIRVVPNNSKGSNESKVPYITVNDMQSYITTSEFKGDSNAFSANNTILTAYNVADKKLLWITLPFNLTPKDKSIISACGRWSSDKTAKNLGLFYVEYAIAY